jgi:SET domain-containing protein
MRKRKWHKALLYLGPSKIHGIGCFSDTRIKKGEFVRVWSPEDSRWVPLKKAHASPHKKLFQRFGIRTTGGYWAPIDFLRISVGWYMNHSETPNLQSDDGDVTYYALRDIEPGEEVTIDYRRMDDVHDNLSRDVVISGRQRKRSKPALKRRPSDPPARDRPQARRPRRAARSGRG